MREHIVSYRNIGIILLLFVLLISGCSSSNKISSDETLTESHKNTDKNVAVEIISKETNSEPIEASVTEVNLENYFDGINGSAVIYKPSENI